MASKSSESDSSLILPGQRPAPRKPPRQEGPATPRAGTAPSQGKQAPTPRKAAAAEPPKPSAPAPTDAPPTDAPPAEALPADTGRFAALLGSLWRRRRFWQGSSAFVGSLLVHLIVLLALALWALPPIVQEMLPTLTVAATDSEEEATLEAAIESQTSSESEAAAAAMATASSATTGAPAVAMLSSEPSLDAAVVEQSTVGSVNIGDPLSGIPGADALMGELPTGTLGEARAVVDGYGQALDRLTQEILRKLETGPVLLVWVFDQSESMKDDQAEIRGRLDKVYLELGLQGATNEDALLTSVVSFGENYARHTEKPVSDLEQVKLAIDEVPSDPSGKEMTCQAIGLAISQHKSIANRTRRRMMLVLVSDESGDRDNNAKFLEPTIQEALSARCPIYILGREAVFGYPFAHIGWRHPQTGHLHRLPIDRGPETGFVEQLQTDGFHRRYDAFSSGFGPYPQARMASATNGIFFMLPGEEVKVIDQEKRRFALEKMENYQPDLRPLHEVAYDRDQSELRTMLYKIVYDLNPYDPEIAKVIELREELSGNPATFAKQVQQELAQTRVYLTYLVQAEKAWESVQHLRESEYSRRWQANCDLLYAQLIAYRVRILEYGATLENFLEDPDRVPLMKPGGYRLHHWDVRTRKETITGDSTVGEIERSKKMFDKVIAEHPGTPWAARAEWELRRGFGAELHPHYHKPGKPGPRPKVTIPVPKL